jgi:uncharacterized protein (DUF1501 family)
MRTRRELLHHAGVGLGAAAFLGAVGRFPTLEAASAEAASDYRALVCIFLAGGNDGNNTVIPYDDYASYQKVRGTTVNLTKDSILKVSAPSHGAAFGLHPALVELQSLYAKGNVALLANVGTLAAPTTRAQYLAGAAVPDDLFSHSNQQAEWQTAVVKATDPAAQTGWGGRMADAIASLNATSFPASVSTAGLSLFQTGVHSEPIVPGGGLQGFTTSATSQARLAAMRKLLTLDTAQSLVGAESALMGRAIDDTNTLNTALAQAVALKTTFPSTTLGTQLKSIASVIAARSALKASRQVFFASFGSFDTHTGQIATQQSLLGQLSQAMGAFYAATVELGIQNSVTSFTLSDFCRTFQPGSGSGTDHAWGNHHFVMGGSVKGGDFYGRYPTLALGGPDDADTRGRWIPTTAVDQYGATLARWFGVPSGSMRTVFPNLGAFATDDLGFM